MRVIIIEDEVPAAARLNRMLRELGKGIEVLCTLDSVEASVNYLRGMDAGSIDRGHYENFISLTREAKSPGISSGAQRRKDRASGRQAESRYSRATGTTYEDLRGLRRVRRRTELRVAGAG